MDRGALQVICWRWTPHAQYRSKFSASHINTLAKMVQRHLHMPYGFTCITDNWKGLDSGINVIPLWKDLGELRNPHGELNPSCYRRLKAFSGEMASLIGPRFVSIDLDCVIVDDITPVLSRKEEFIIWGDQLKTTPYNGSMWMMDAGARSQVWTKFDPVESPKATLKAHLLGSDQAWISHVLGPNEATWTAKDGVMSYRKDIRRAHGALPDGARIVFFQGNVDPWSPVAKRFCPWIEEHYR